MQIGGLIKSRQKFYFFQNTSIFIFFINCRFHYIDVTIDRLIVLTSYSHTLMSKYVIFLYLPPTWCIFSYQNQLLIILYQQRQEDMERRLGQKVQMVRTITNDYEIEEKEIVKFINWGKGDIQQALNYYFNHLQKGKIKKKSNSQTNKQKSLPATQPSLQLLKNKQSIQQKGSNIIPNGAKLTNNQNSNNLCSQLDKVSQNEIQQVNEYMRNSIGSSQSQESVAESEKQKQINAFSVLKQGSMKHKKTHDFIKMIRKVYKLPIKGKPQSQLIKNINSCLPDNEGKIPQQFKIVDCLSVAFNHQVINGILQQKSAQNKKEDKKQINQIKQPKSKINRVNKKEKNKKVINQNKKQDITNISIDIYRKQIVNKELKQKMQNQFQADNREKDKRLKTNIIEKKQMSKPEFIQLQISHSQQEGQNNLHLDFQNIVQQKQEQSEFRDIDQYNYKHVYTNSQTVSNKVQNKYEKTGKSSPFQQDQNQQNKAIFNDVQNQNTKKLNNKNNKGINKDKKRGKTSSNSIPSKGRQNGQSKGKNGVRHNNDYKTGKQKQIQLFQSRIHQQQGQNNGHGQQLSSLSQDVNMNNITLNSQYIQQGKCIDENQILVGEYFVKAFCTQKRRYESSCLHKQVKIVSYIEPIKVKKRNFGKSSQRNMNMRIFYDSRQVGRINDDQVRIIMPLIDQKLIRVQFFIHQIPTLADVFKPISLLAKVYFQSKLITQPIIQNFQPQQKDKDRVHQLSGLLSKLGLNVLTHPLIKTKSKYLNQQSKRQKKQIKQVQQSKKKSFDIMPLSYRESQQYKMEQQLKNRRQLDRMKNDYTFKQKQQSLKDLMKKNQQFLKQKTVNSSPIADQQDRSMQNGLVKKKVIQIDNQHQKNKLSQLIDLHQDNFQPFYPQNNFRSQLYEYQALALSWMLRRQGFLSDNQQKQQLHPLWTQYQLKNNQKYRLYFNQLTGQLCVKKPISIVKCKGGILADQMGLGKTVMMTALIISNPPMASKLNKNILQENEQSLQFARTLVIVPLTLLSQWQSQIAKHTKNQKVVIYYSSDRKKIANTLGKYDVVISTYGTISHQFSQGLHNKKMGIYKYKWHRIILDEAHYIKGRIIQTSKAVYELNGTHKWCLTGTPIQNNVTDIFSLLHFIRYTPWSQFACWNRFIVKPMQQQEESVFQALRTILKQVFLRRTKGSYGPNGKPIIQLPPRISKVQLLTMSSKQRQFYDSIYASSRSDFDQLISKGILQAKYMQVLQILMRLRQICCHPILFKSITKFSKTTEQFEVQLRKLIAKSQKRAAINESQQQDEYYQPIIDVDNEQYRVKTNGNTINQQYFNQVIEKVANQNLDTCIICLEQPEDPVINCCLHIFCKTCNIRQIQQKGSCAFCRRNLTKEDFIYLPRENRLNIKKDDQKQGIFLSTKMIALNQHLSKLDKSDKVVIFSQFLGMLDLLQGQLNKNNFNYVRMQGSNTHKERTRIVKSFQQDPQVQIFLVSLKTAGVGLNLVAANKVFLIDPWWNPAVQEQAIERVHRIGQKRSVQIIRFIMDKTIQTRMLQLNTQKKALSQNVLNQNQQKDGSANQKIQKLKYLMENY